MCFLPRASQLGIRLLPTSKMPADGSSLPPLLVLPYGAGGPGRTLVGARTAQLFQAEPSSRPAVLAEARDWTIPTG